GLLEDKVAALIRGLPKALRRNFVPAPDFARAFLESELGQGGEGALVAALARFLARSTGVEVPPAEWDLDALPGHLRFNLRLLDGDTVLAESRDLDGLRARFGARAQQAFADRAGQALARESLLEFPPEGVPDMVRGAAGVPAYPALVAPGGADDGVAL